MRVLVCDDDSDVGGFLRDLFEIEGWEAAYVDSGELCLSEMQDGATDAYDVLVLDHKMPGLLGTQVADRLRSGGFDRPIVLCSAHVGPDYRDEITRLGLIQVNKIDVQAVVRVARAAVLEAAAARR